MNDRKILVGLIGANIMKSLSPALSPARVSLMVGELSCHRTLPVFFSSLRKLGAFGAGTLI